MICFTAYGSTDCDTPAPDHDSYNGPTWHLSSGGTAVTGPTCQCDGDAFGYAILSASNGCWDAKSFTSSVSCGDFWGRRTRASG